MYCGRGWGQICWGHCHTKESLDFILRKPQDSGQEWHGQVWVEKGKFWEQSVHTHPSSILSLLFYPHPVGKCFPCKGHFKPGHNKHCEKQLLTMETLTEWWCKMALCKALSGPGLCNLVVAHRKRLRARFFLTVLKAIISFPYLNRWPCVSLSREFAKGKGQINKQQNPKKTGPFEKNS